MTGDAIRWGVLALVFAGAGGGLYYQYQVTRPCAVPIHYSIGAVDSRFHISTDALATDANVAATIWDTAAGKKLFTYDPEAKLKINLVYDERQAQAQSGSSITKQQAALDVTRRSLDQLKNQCLADRKKCDPTLQSRVASYNEDVALFNSRVATYNTTAGQSFEEGQFIRDEKGERINVFEFIGSEQLERVLAHEFGHALGLEHNEDPKAIMYAENESGGLTPSAVDLASLHALCGT